MDLFLGIISTFGWWAALFAVILAYWLFLFSGLHDENNAARRRWITVLRYRNFDNHYRSTIMRGLDALDRALAPGKFEKTGRIRPTANTVKVAFGSGLLHLNLGLALFYPVISLWVQWAFNGADVSIGGLVILPAEERRIIRIILGFGLLIQIGASLLAVRAFSEHSSPMAKIGPTLVAFIAATICILVYLLSNSNSSTGAFVFVIISAYVFSFIVALVFARIGNKFDTMLGAKAGPGTFAVAVTLAVSLTYYSFQHVFGLFENYLPETLIILITVILSYTFAAICALIQAFISRKTRFEMVSLILFSVFTIIFIFFAIISDPPLYDFVERNSAVGVLIFIGALPIFNGLLDFISFGTTIFLIRWRKADPFVWVFDILVALSALIALVSGFIAFVIFSTPSGGIPLIDLPTLFHDIRTDPTEYWWLSFMLFSTLLPTTIHAIVSLSSIHTFTSFRLRSWIAHEISETRDVAIARRGKLALALMNTIAWWVPVFVVVYIGLWVWTVDHGLRDGLVDLSEMLAKYLFDMRNGAGSYVPLLVDPSPSAQ